MVGRTVVIGDIPWVAQSAEAFLSKVRVNSFNFSLLHLTLIRLVVNRFLLVPTALPD
jgi:hypothetical protein